MGLDSVELVLAVEEHIQIDIPNGAAAKILTVRHMHEFIVAEPRRRSREADPDAVFARLREIIVEQLPVEPSEVVLDAEFARDLRIG
jgi:acyl carrier protein